MISPQEALHAARSFWVHASCADSWQWFWQSCMQGISPGVSLERLSISTTGSGWITGTGMCWEILASDASTGCEIGVVGTGVVLTFEVPLCWTVHAAIKSKSSMAKERRMSKLHGHLFI
jgi:hypothetical protein